MFVAQEEARPFHSKSDLDKMTEQQRVELGFFLKNVYRFRSFQNLFLNTDKPLQNRSSTFSAVFREQ